MGIGSAASGSMTGREEKGQCGMISREAILNAIEGLINFVANPKPDQAARDKALRGLIELRVNVELDNVRDIRLDPPSQETLHNQLEGAAS